MQRMKGIRSIVIVSNPTYIFLLWISRCPKDLRVEMIHFEPRSCILMNLSSASKKDSDVSLHLSIKSITAVKCIPFSFINYAAHCTAWLSYEKSL